jgi:hypothetical protein
MNRFRNAHSIFAITEMIVYRDIISEDEVLSDAFKLSPVVDKDGAVVCLECSVIIIGFHTVLWE